jgi:hypothetical protein
MKKLLVLLGLLAFCSYPFLGLSLLSIVGFFYGCQPADPKLRSPLSSVSMQMFAPVRFISNWGIF